MKALSQIIGDYTICLQQNSLQLAYKGILEFMAKLRADFIKQYPQYDAGSMYPGYLDMSYFSLSTQSLKDKGLKLAVVYLHQSGHFEVWLSAKNRAILKTYKPAVGRILADSPALFHDPGNQDAVMEFTLASAPDFDAPAALMNTIEQGVETFATTITRRLLC